MSQPLNTPNEAKTPEQGGRRPQRNSLTAGRMPSWTWIVVAAGALVLGAGVTALVGGGGFSVVGWLVLSAILYIVGMYVVTLALETRRRASDAFWRNLVWTAFLVALIPLVSVLWTVLANGLSTLISNPQVLWLDMNNMDGSDDIATVQAGGGSIIGGFSHALIGTLWITLIATLISVPVGLLASIYLVEYSRGGAFARSIRFFVDVMTGIPSIVAGLFAIAAMPLVLELFTGSRPQALQNSTMALTAGIALSVLMIPVVVRSTEEMLRVVPNELREASYALGVRKWRTIVKVVLPTAISGIVSGVFLAIARVVGETAPILLTAGYVNSINWDPVDGPMMALPVYIYRQLIAPTAPQAPDPSFDRAWAAALVLIVIVMGLNLLARLIAKSFAPKTAGR